MPVKKNFSMICAWSILVVYIFVSGCNSIKKTDLILTKTPTIETRTTKTQTLTPTITNLPRTQLTHISPTLPTNMPVTFTPLPTYPPDEANKIILDLFKNPTCKLPCWWNITPGKTDWNNAWQFLGRFARNEPFVDSQNFDPEFLPGYIILPVELGIVKKGNYEYFKTGADIEVILNKETLLVDFIDLQTGYIDTITIQDILSRYGKPQQVYVTGSPHPVQEYSGISIILYYPNYGFITSYFAHVKDEDWNKPTFITCFQKQYTMYLWNNEIKLDFYERMNISGITRTELAPNKTLQETTILNIDQFYDNWGNGQSQPCVEFKSATFFN